MRYNADTAKHDRNNKQIIWVYQKREMYDFSDFCKYLPIPHSYTILFIIRKKIIFHQS